MSSNGRRVAAGSGLLLFVVAAIGIVATIRASRPTDRSQGPDRVANVLAKTIETRGVDAAVAEYRALREQGFPGFKESEAETNRLGYKLLGQDQTQSAIEVFRLNAETHPGSANVHDSLGEAYLAAGNTALAAQSYEKAVAINPKMKTAVAELQRLTHIRRKSYPLIVLFHIGAGSLGLLSGALAASLRKGSRRHAVAGRVFVVAMVAMSLSGAYRGFTAPEREPVNVLMGLLTFYLVATAWMAARRRTGGTGPFDWAALLLVTAVATGLIRLAMTDARFAAVTLVFGAVALMAAALDVRMIARGGVVGKGRIVRHLWRMCTALYIAVMSFFLGQSQVFPYAVRKTGLLVVPGILVVALLIFWLIRVSFTKKYGGSASPKPKLDMPPARRPAPA